MKITKEEIAYNGRFITVKNYFIEKNKNQTGIWEAVEIKNANKVVSIFALTKNNEVILEKIFRVPLKSYVIELPAGLMDKKNETPEDVIKRELLEETGYKIPGKIEFIIEGPFNAGLTPIEIIFFFGKNAEKISEPNLENEEDITVIKVPIDDLINFLTTKNEEYYIDVKILSVLPIIQKKGLI